MGSALLGMLGAGLGGSLASTAPLLTGIPGKVKEEGSYSFRRCYFQVLMVGLLSRKFLGTGQLHSLDICPHHRV